MTNLLISVLLVGSAVTYVIELLDLFFFEFVNKSTLNKFLTLPLSFGGIYVLQDFSKSMIVTIPASTFVCLAITMWLDRPTILNKSKQPRLY